MSTRITMVGGQCDRCGKLASELAPYKLTDSIVYRGKTIEHPWLCLKCFAAEKKKWWRRCELSRR